ncbi:hypothetical protein GCM10009754_11420 [Amycolatopsis minnesotensis]|uniref:Uncharacterized protein n=1 Tax=Amycolatopsis minnesotensis TaxID=337894 RepID=A0ABP5BI80_9PSEU
MRLCSAETAAASALTGVLTDPRDFAADAGLAYPVLALPAEATVNTRTLMPPLPPERARDEELVKGPGISSPPDFPELPGRTEAPVLFKLGDNVSTDEIAPARALPFRSNVPKLADFTFTPVDGDYPPTTSASDPATRSCSRTRGTSAPMRRSPSATPRRLRPARGEHPRTAALMTAPRPGVGQDGRRDGAGSGSAAGGDARADHLRQRGNRLHGRARRHRPRR